MADIKQATKEFVNPVSWLRLFVAGLLILGGLAAWNLIKRPTQTQNVGKIIVGKGGQLSLGPEASKKTWIGFLEPYINQDNHKRMETGIRIGARHEW